MDRDLIDSQTVMLPSLSSQSISPSRSGSPTPIPESQTSASTQTDNEDADATNSSDSTAGTIGITNNNVIEHELDHKHQREHGHEHGHENNNANVEYQEALLKHDESTGMLNVHVGQKLFMKGRFRAKHRSKSTSNLNMASRIHMSKGASSAELHQQRHYQHQHHQQCQQCQLRLQHQQQRSDPQEAQGSMYISPSRFTAQGTSGCHGAGDAYNTPNRYGGEGNEPIRSLLLPHYVGRDSTCSLSTYVTDSNRSMTSYGSLDSLIVRTIRFQVVVWHVGRPDEVLGKVDMKFRISMFWNIPEDFDPELGYGRNNRLHRKVWMMHGRQRAYQKELKEVSDTNGIIYVPPVSILNAVDFEALGDPEVCLINTEENLMKWSCLYKASMLQDGIHVSNFPHDQHDLQIKLAILKHRQPRKRWDRHRWKLDLATIDDTGDSIQTPHGTIVEHCKVPGFSCDDEGLRFEFVPLEFGTKGQDRDQQLQIKLRIRRESAYYDRNIIPLLTALNVVGICTLTLDAMQFGNRGEMILATAFVDIGIRMTVDSKLPVVGYQIKMQYVLNNLFFGLLFLVIASSLSYVVDINYGQDYSNTVDQFAAAIEGLHLMVILSIYYGGSKSCWAKVICMASDFTSGPVESESQDKI